MIQWLRLCSSNTGAWVKSLGGELRSYISCGMKEKKKSSKWRESESEVTHSCPTLCDTMDCSLPGSSVCGIFQTRILEWVAISFSRWSSQPRDWTRVSCIVGRYFTIWAPREVSGGTMNEIQLCLTPNSISFLLCLSATM